MPPGFSLLVSPDKQDRSDCRDGCSQEWRAVNFEAEPMQKNYISNDHQNRRNCDQKVCSAHLSIRSGRIRRGGFVGFPHRDTLDSRRIGRLAHLF